MAGWDNLYNLIAQEIIQRQEEGCNVTGFTERLTEVGNNETELMRLYHELMSLQIDPCFPFKEPNDLEEIKKERPKDINITLKQDLTKEEWLDKFYGAWLGRCIGCALGKPLESGSFMYGKNGNPGWLNVYKWFTGANAWPINYYTPEYSTAKDTDNLRLSPYYRSTREHIKFMETDDDIRYTVLGLLMLENKGLDWDSWDVGKMWHRHLPFHLVCTAETQSYLNFANLTNHRERIKPENWQEQLDWVRSYLNPYREWIGAQIRVDGYAHGAGGNPELAAELAYRDASFSHVKNGIYGAMFFAAVIASAFVENDIEKLIQIGLSKIPSNCRLSHDIKKAVEIAKNAKSELELVEKIYEEFKHYNAVHTNNNAALCVASLVYGNGDFEKSITTAVLGGWDTDCNGATVGSIVGAMIGANSIPLNWKTPLNDTLYSEISGFHPINISECARRSYEVFMKLRNL